jgi:hypothetical protein
MQPRAGTEAFDLFIAIASLRGWLNGIGKLRTDTPRHRVVWLGELFPQYGKAEAQEGDLE